MIGRAVALALLAAAVPWLQDGIDRRVGPFRRTNEVLYLWSGRHLERLVPGFKGLAADIYWMRTVQYFGGQRVFAEDKNFDLLYPLVDITTTLDPRLEIAYHYGAVFLSEPQPGGAGRPHDGIAILAKGCKAMPNNWRLRQELGFFHFLFLNDAETASRILMEASQLPGAAFWLRTLAADILLKGGERAGARRMWKEILDTSEAPILKVNAEERLRRLDALDLADEVARSAEEYKKRYGHLPASLEELGRAGLLRRPPVDSTGTPFAYDPATGQVTLSRGSPLWRPD